MNTKQSNESNENNENNENKMLPLDINVLLKYFNLEELHLLNDGIGYIPITLNNSLVTKLVTLRGKVTTMLNNINQC